jgi:hypothetical protein
MAVCRTVFCDNGNRPGNRGEKPLFIVHLSFVISRRHLMADKHWAISEAMTNEQ